jgi:hypothetical protein
MAKAQSTLLPLGTSLPPFELPDTVSGRPFSSRTLAGAPSVIAILCNHCPYVVHVRAGLGELGRFCDARGVRMVGISVNDVSRYPEDGPDRMKEVAREAGWTFPYLYDASQQSARELHAECTPEFYVFDAEGRLAYRGQLDDSRPNSGRPVTGADVRAALEALLAGGRPNTDQHPSVGCSIKWK